MENLVRQAKTSKEAFADLYNQNVGAVYNFFLVRCANKEEAEELTSDSWMIAVSKIHTLRSDDLISFKAWIFKIAKNLLKKRWQKKSLKIIPYEEFLDTREELTTASEECSKAELKQIWRFVDKLPKKQKEVVLLRFASDLQNKEIAKVMRVSEKTVASNLSRALDKLKQDAEYLQ